MQYCWDGAAQIAVECVSVAGAVERADRDRVSGDPRVRHVGSRYAPGSGELLVPERDNHDASRIGGGFHCCCAMAASWLCGLLAEVEEAVPVEDQKTVRRWVDLAKAEQQSRPAYKPAPDHP